MPASACLGGFMKVLVVDDHPLILEALGLLLPQLSPGTEVCIAFRSGSSTR
jgi:DNA-binding NarL/FixJ family response regulator